MPEESIRAALVRAAAELGVPGCVPRLERPKDPEHGDWSTNLPMTLASTLRRPPRDIASDIAGRLDLAAADVTSVEVAGPGFLNFRLSAGSVAGELAGILEAADAFGRSDAGKGRRIMVEWVSANPTGPLHLGHGRQAALGAAIASLLEWTGWSVHREFYYNDAG
ncbi:MAG TPA: arginine--tRNA ligase, partial [Longimicrobiales bacterium]